MKNFAVVLCAGLCLTTLSTRAATDPDWVPLASTDDMTWDGRAGTRVPSTTRGGVDVWSAEGRVINKRTKKIEFEKWYVSVQDCQRGAGKLVTLDMAGNFKYETDFVLRGGSVASGLADTLCYPVTQSALKGI